MQAAPSSTYRQFSGRSQYILGLSSSDASSVLQESVRSTRQASWVQVGRITAHSSPFFPAIPICTVSLSIWFAHGGRGERRLVHTCARDSTRQFGFNHRITQPLWLEKSSKIIKANHRTIMTVPTKPHPASVLLLMISSASSPWFCWRKTTGLEGSPTRKKHLLSWVLPEDFGKLSSSTSHGVTGFF